MTRGLKAGMQRRGFVRIIRVHFPGSLRKTFPNLPRSSAEMAERKRTKNKIEKGLDTFSQKRPVGRPWRVRASEVAGRSYNLRLQFSQIWDTVGESLIEAQTEEDVLKALDMAGQ